MIRTVLLACVAAIGLGSGLPGSMAGAQAADLAPTARPASAPAPVASAFSWTGFYVGTNVGYGWSDRDFSKTIVGSGGGPVGVTATEPLSATHNGTDHGHGWLGGGQLGYNYQFAGQWVAGVEADLQAADISSSTNACFAGFGTGVCGTRDTELKSFGTVRARLGYAFDRVLVYGTGGWAWGHGTNTDRFTCIGASCPAVSNVPPTSPEPTGVDVNPYGWAAGAGVEWAFLPNWTVRAEYLHLQFNRTGEDRIKTSAFMPGLVVTSHVSSKLTADIVRLGLSYRFGL